ncbi:MAG: hypothetical protein WCI87_07045 [Euryarchaeota archaeon]
MEIEINVYRHVVPSIVILLLTVLFVGVVTIHPTIHTAAPFPLEGAALKYRGVAYLSYAPNEYASAGSNLSLNAVKNTGANYVSVLVTQYLSNNTSNTIFPDPNQTPTDDAVIDAIKDIHARGMGIFLKPQLFCEDGQGADDIAPTNPAAWFASYATFINHYAQIAQNNSVELFCVGCELRQLDTSNYYANWRTVISGVRAIYNGPLTYATNHDTYARISFWGLLDYAGIDAYFPLSNAKTPSITDLVGGWSYYVDYDGTHNWTHEIETWQATVNKPVMFSEIGYRSIDYAAKHPWDWEETGVYRANGQANCYEAAWRVFANKPWFAGMFWWGWFSDPNAGGAGNTDYTPQNKPAQSVLTAQWQPSFV